MSSTQDGSNGNPPSTPVVSGLQSAVGLGSSQQGAPQVTPPNQANFEVPNATQIQQAVQTLQNAQISPDLSGLNQVTGAQSQLAQQDMQQLQQGAQPGQSAAEMGTQTALQNNANTANAATQNTAASAANPLAAARVAGQQQASQNAQTVAAGTAARANEENAIRQNAQNALSAATQGTLAGASQRMQAQIASSNLVQQAIADQTALSMQKLQGSMAYAQMSQQYQLQQRQDYIQSQIQAIKNQQMMVGAILSAAGQAAGAALGKMPTNTPSVQLDSDTTGANTGSMDQTAMNTRMTEASV